MYWLRRLLLLLPNRRRSRAGELNEELEANLALALEEEAAASGLPADEAARIARRDFGSLTRAREESRGVWFPGWDTLSQDLRFAVRTLVRAPGFTVVAILSLALGTGAATALFSLVNTVTLKPLAYREAGRLLAIREVVPPLAHIYPTVPVNLQHFQFWRAQSRSFESLTAISSDRATLLTGGEAELIGSANVTPNLFETLGVQPQLGRGFQPEEEQRDRSKVVILTDGLWKRRFGGSPQIVGQSIRLDGGTYTVVGILPASFRFPKNEDLGALTRLAERTEIFRPLPLGDSGWGGDYDYMVVGRLASGFTMEQAKAELNLSEQRLTAEHKLPYNPTVQIQPLGEVIGANVRTSLGVLLAAVLLLVLIVCVNLANLLLARGSARAREFSLRIALGASRSRLLISALVETLLLSCAGGALGVLAARGALTAFIRTSPVDLPRLDEVQIDGQVLAFALLLSLLCGMLFGLLPALRFSRADPQTALRAQSYTATGGRRGLEIREWLVGSEVALSTVLLVLAGLLVGSLWHVLRVDRGFTAEHALDITVPLPSRYRAAQERAAFFDLAVDRLRALPGVRSVAVVNKAPLTGESNVNQVQVDGAGSAALDPATRQTVMVNVRFVSQDYFATLGIPLLQGRTIEAADRDRSVAVVSARLAAKLWPGRSPLGQMLSTGSGVRDVQVVGVVADVHTTRLERDPTLMIYTPFWKHAYMTSDLVVRAAGDPGALRQEVRRTIQGIDSGIPAPKMRTMDEIVAESVAQRRFQMRVAAAFALSALLLAALGIYGVVAYGIHLRRREFGIRMALGARAAEVCRLVLWQGLRPVIFGLAAGILAAVAAGRLVRTLLFGINASDGATLAAVAGVLAGVAVLACLLPSLSAVRIDPVRVLRDE